jgi:hypothetical protein
MNTQQAYLEWIDQKILEHQTEIARLTVARDVLMEMPGKRLEGKVERAVKRQRHPTRADVKIVHQHIINRLSDKPMKPIEIINAMGIGPTKEERRSWYNGLARLVKDGVLMKDAEGKYHLKPKLEVPAA